MAAPTGLTNGPVSEPTKQEPADPDPSGEPGGAEGGRAPAADPGIAEQAPAVAVAVPVLAHPETIEVEAPAPSTEQSRGMSLLAVAAAVFGVIALAGVAVGILAVATHGFRAKSVVQYRPAAVFSLRPGNCINSAPNGLGVTVLSCATPHDAEVFAAFPLTASSWPGTAAVRRQASNGCVSRLAGYLNPQYANAGFAQEYFYPDRAAWQAGVRTVVCEIRASTGPLTGSVRGLS
jgi:hypothetical protein